MGGDSARKIRESSEKTNEIQVFPKKIMRHWNLGQIAKNQQSKFRLSLYSYRGLKKETVDSNRGRNGAKTKKLLIFYSCMKCFPNDKLFANMHLLQNVLENQFQWVHMVYILVKYLLCVKLQEMFLFEKETYINV